MEVVLATRNKGKIREIQKALSMPRLTISTFEQFPDFPQPEESGSTLEENAVIKARALVEHTGLPALADDSGLIVDYLGGRPGVRSSRYAGPEGDPERNIDLLLSELEGVPASERKARFSCVLALAFPDGEVRITRGECEGTILTSRRGSGGFGYDPVFKPSGFDRSMAEISLEEKNKISHRGKALGAMRQILMG